MTTNLLGQAVHVIRVGMGYKNDARRLSSLHHGPTIQHPVEFRNGKRRRITSATAACEIQGLLRPSLLPQWNGNRG
jgi:hypothetical protein